MLPREYVVEADVVGVLKLVEVEVVLIDVEVLVLALEYVENTVVVGVLTLADVDLVVLVLTDVDTLVDLLKLNEVDVDTDFEVEIDTLVENEVEILVLSLEYVFETDVVGVLTDAEVEVDLARKLVK